MSQVHYLFGGNPGNNKQPTMRLDDLWMLKVAHTTHIRTHKAHAHNNECLPSSPFMHSWFAQLVSRFFARPSSSYASSTTKSWLRQIPLQPLASCRQTCPRWLTTMTRRRGNRLACRGASGLAEWVVPHCSVPSSLLVPSPLIQSICQKG